MPDAPGETSISSSPQGVMPGIVPPTYVQSLRPSEGDRAPLLTANPDRAFTSEDIERVRKEEKDKVYNRLESEKAKREELEQRLALIEQERQERLTADEAARQAAEEVARKKIEEETDVRSLLEQKEREWNSKLENLERERAQERALLNREREYAELMAYRERAISQQVDNILPELVEYISGNTPAEVDESVARAVAKSESVMGNAAQAFSGARQQQQGTRVTVPANGPLDGGMSTDALSPEAVTNIPLSEWGKHRERFGVSGTPGFNRGLFG